MSVRPRSQENPKGKKGTARIVTLGLALNNKAACFDHVEAEDLARQASANGFQTADCRVVGNDEISMAGWLAGNLRLIWFDPMA